MTTESFEFTFGHYEWVDNNLDYLLSQAKDRFNSLDATENERTLLVAINQLITINRDLVSKIDRLEEKI